MAVLAIYATSSWADTQTSLGDRSGEGSTAFTGLAQAPEANLFTGSLGTSIPIQVPPGRNHMTPKLSLGYSSSAGPSPYGFGWNLTVGQIERTTRWGVPRCDSDHFDEFVLILPGGGSSEMVHVGSNEYRPRVEQGYASATFSQSENKWTARDATGIIYTFGDNPDARLSTFIGAPAKQVYGDGSCDFTTAWALTKIQDPNGNTINITWDSIDPQSNQLLPLLIEYGGHTSGTPAHFHKVQFYWGENGTTSPTYRQGVPQRVREFLIKIDISTSKPPANGVFRTYQFHGDGTGPLYQLQSVTVQSLPEQLFVYSDWVGPAHASSAVPVTVPSTFDTLRQWSKTFDVGRTILDMNGDGLLDLVRGNLSGIPPSWQVHFGWVDVDEETGAATFGFNTNFTPWSTPDPDIREVKNGGCLGAEYCTIRDTFDITGDGVVDYVEATDLLTDWRVYPGRKLGSSWGFGSFIPWSAPEQRIRETAGHEFGGDATYKDVVDMTGDGLPDYVLANEEPGLWLVYRNTGAGFEEPPLEFAVPNGLNAVSGISWTLLDFNGDGLPDIVRNGGPHYDPIPGADRYAEILQVYFNTGQGFTVTPHNMLTPHGSGCYPSSGGVFGTSQSAVGTDLMDINGDGLPDCVSDELGGWRVLLNTGGDLEDIEYVQSEVQPEIWSAQAPRVWGDMEGFIRLTEQAYNMDEEPVGNGHQLTDMIDLNGDGFLDRVDRGSCSGPTCTWNVELSSRMSKPYLLEMMENGLGGTNTVKYEPSSHFPHLDANGAPTLPFISWVVTATRLNDGQCIPGAGVDVFDPVENQCIDPEDPTTSGSELLTYIKYGEGLFAVETDSQGNLIREFRGFGKVEQRDIFGNITMNFFAQELNKKGLLEAALTFAYDESLETNSLVRLESNGWGESPIDSGARTKLWLSSNTRENYDGLASQHRLSATTVNHGVDSFGNVTLTESYGTGIESHVVTKTEFAAGTGDKPRDKPKSVLVWDDSDGDRIYTNGVDRLLEQKRFYYDNQALGQLIKGNLTKVESYLDTENRWLATTTAYNAYGSINKVTDAEGRDTVTSYNADFNGAFLYPTSTTNELGHITLRTFDYRHGKQRSITSPNGVNTKVSYEYDSLGRILSEVHPGDTSQSPTVLYTYDFTHTEPVGNQAWPLSTTSISQKQDATTRRTATTYLDALGRPRYSVSPRVVAGSSVDVRSNEVIYDAGGNIVRRYVPYPHTGSRGGFAASDYHLNLNPDVIDPLGRASATIQPDGTTTTIALSQGYRTLLIDAAGESSLISRDGMEREVRREIYQRPGGGEPVLYSSSESTYDGLGRVLAVYQNRELANLPMKTMQYDTMGRRVAMIDRDSGTWTYGYDDVGNPLWQEDPKVNQHMQYCHDELNRMTHKCAVGVDRSTNSTHLACSASSEGTCSELTDAHYEYDDPAVNLSKGYVTRIVDNAGETRITGYDNRGRRIGVIRQIVVPDVPSEPIGEAEFYYSYNSANDVVATVYPDGEIVQVGYDASGQPMTLSNTVGYFYVESAHYDLFGRPTSIVKGNDTGDVAIYSGADKNHRLGTIEFTAPAFTHTQQYQHNVRGQVKLITDSSNAATSLKHNGGQYKYDGLGRLTEYDSTIETTPEVPDRTYAYDAWGNITQRNSVTLTYPNPTVAGSAPHRVSQVDNGGVLHTPQHDTNGNRRSLYEAPGTGSASGHNGTATFDAEDRVAKIDLTATGGADVYFDYDAGGQLKTKVVEVGTSTKITKYYAPEIEVRPDGKTIKSYFFGGRRVASWLKLSSDSTWQTPSVAAATWSSGIAVASLWGDRPVLRVSLSSGAETAALTATAVLFVTLFLLPGGRRRRAVVGLRLGRGTVIFVTLISVTGTLPWPLLIQPAAAQCGGCECPPDPPPPSELNFFQYDHLGSPLVITNGAGAVLEEIRYHPYGGVRARFNGAGAGIADPSPDEVRYEFTGYEAERNTGLSYANARFYDPELGSFLSHDPAAQQWSPYAYVAWDPANLTDPTGAVLLIDDIIMIAILASVVATTINGLANGASFSDALAAGVTGWGLAAVGAFVGGAIGIAVLQPTLYAAFSALPGVSAEAAGTLAAATQFAGGLGQAAHSASQGDLSGLLGLGLSLALGSLYAKGAQSSTPMSQGRQRTDAALHFDQQFGPGGNQQCQLGPPPGFGNSFSGSAMELAGEIKEFGDYLDGLRNDYGNRALERASLKIGEIAGVGRRVQVAVVYQRGDSPGLINSDYVKEVVFPYDTASGSWSAPGTRFFVTVASGKSYGLTPTDVIRANKALPIATKPSDIGLNTSQVIPNDGT